MRRKMSLLGSAAIALGLSLTAGGAHAAPADVVNPTTDQKAAVIKAWSKADGGPGYKGPKKCLKVNLSASNPDIAGLTYKGGNKKSCRQYAFDGAALLYGTKKTKWYLLTEGSDLPGKQCKALANLMGEDPWVDLKVFGMALGCENYPLT